MKKLFRYLALLMALITLNSTSCYHDRVLPNNYNAIIMDRNEFENAVALLPEQPVVKSGKIYVNGNFMYVNDLNKGFHVYDYSNPANPNRIAFVKIPGATDLAIRNNVLYINQAVDLVTIDYNALSNQFNVLHRNRNVFPQKRSPSGFFANLGDNQIVIDWTPN